MNIGRWKSYSDVELVVAALIGDLRAFDELAVRYRPAMLAVAGKIVGSPQAAEDVVQDALLLAFKALPHLKNMARFGAWLHAITRHRAYRYRKEIPRAASLSDFDQALLAKSQAIASNPAQILERRREQQELDGAIVRLAPEFRLVIRLYYWDDMPQQRIADFLGIPLTTVKWRLHRARQILRQHLRKPAKRRP